MKFHPRPSRRLTLLVVFLLYVFSARDFALHPDSAASNLVWLQVPQTDPQTETLMCLNWLGEHSECSSVNLWHLTTSQGHTKDLLIQSAEFKDSCVGRTVTGAVKIVRCDRRFWGGGQRNRWTLDELTNFLSVPLTRRTSPRVLGTLPTGKGPTVVALGDAAVAYSVVPLIPLHKLSLIVEDSPSATAAGSEKTEWICPRTNLRFPTSLDSYFPAQPRMVLTAADVYTKNVFSIDWKVYAVALYVSEEFRTDPGMEIYRTFQPTELASDEFFFNSLLSAEKPYSRTLFLKLALDIKCSMLIEGLLTEMELTKTNKDILFQAIKGFSDHSCPRGLEIVFNWRGDGSLEILFLQPSQPIIRNEIDIHGVGRDFLAQFLLGSEPVTPNLKVAVGQAWPGFLLGGKGFPDAQSAPATKPNLLQKLESMVPSVYLKLLGKIRLPGWRPHVQRTPGQQRFKVKMYSQRNMSRSSFGAVKDSLLELILLLLVMLLCLPPSLSFTAAPRASHKKG